MTLLSGKVCVFVVVRVSRNGIVARSDPSLSSVSVLKKSEKKTSGTDTILWKACLCRHFPTLWEVAVGTCCVNSRTLTFRNLASYI